MKRSLRKGFPWLRMLLMLVGCLLVMGMTSGCDTSDVMNGLGDLLEDVGTSDGTDGDQPADGEGEEPPVAEQKNGYYDANGTLVAVEGDLKTILYQAVAAGATDLKVSELGYDAARIKDEMTRFFFTDPDLFYLDQIYTTYVAADSTVVQKLVLKYKCEKAQIPDLVADYERMIAEIVSGAPQGGSAFDTVLYFHDYLVQHCAYDYEGTRAEQAGAQSSAVRDAYYFLKDGVGVCQAYMMAMMALCEAVEIPCLPVISEEMNHAWNLVQLDGAWYHVDVTWDDTGGADSAVYPSFVGYRYFLLSDDALVAGGRHTVWETETVAQDTLYDEASWRGANTPMQKLQDRYYCVLFDEADDVSKLYVGDETQMSPIAELDGYWYGDKGFYHAAWASAVLYDDGLLLNTATALWYYDPASDEMTLVCDLSAQLDEGEQIFGICALSETGLVTFVVALDYHGAYELGTYQMP